jgi:hypothetical protein
MDRKITRIPAAAILLAGIVLLLALSGCTAKSPVQPATTLVPRNQDPAAFIAAANECRDAGFRSDGAEGTFEYTSTADCVLTKTLVRLNGSESQGLKTMLEGKSMTCPYAKGKFDSRLVTSLIGGMEYCSGDLKDRLASLLIYI